MAEISPLRRRMIEDMTVRNLSPATQQSYLNAVSKFSRYFGRSPDSDPPPLPANTRYVGPSVDLKRRELSVHLARRPGSRYLVYVCVGTVRFRWRENVPFLRRVIEAFRDRPEFDVVISSGDEQTTRVLGVPPDGVRVFDFLPQLAMLDVADLVITHAGSGTFRECICKEVPMLAYPRNHDQAGNSARIIYHGSDCADAEHGTAGRPSAGRRFGL